MISDQTFSVLFLSLELKITPNSSFHATPSRFKSRAKKAQSMRQTRSNTSISLNSLSLSELSTKTNYSFASTQANTSQFFFPSTEYHLDCDCLQFPPKRLKPMDTARLHGIKTSWLSMRSLDCRLSWRLARMKAEVTLSRKHNGLGSFVPEYMTTSPRELAKSTSLGPANRVQP